MNTRVTHDEQLLDSDTPCLLLCSEFHRALTATSCARGKVKVVKDFCDLLLTRAYDDAVTADAIRNAVAIHGIDNDCIDWKHIQQLASITSSRHSNTYNARRRRALAIVIAAWSGEVAAHYRWYARNYKFLEDLATLARLYTWESAKSRINYVMLGRHELALQDAKFVKIGEAPRGRRAEYDYTACPFSNIDITGAAEVAEDTMDLSRINMWIRRDYPPPIASLKSLRFYHLSTDCYGILIPATDPPPALVSRPVSKSNQGRKRKSVCNPSKPRQRSIHPANVSCQPSASPDLAHSNTSFDQTAQLSPRPETSSPSLPPAEHERFASVQVCIRCNSVCSACFIPHSVPRQNLENLCAAAHRAKDLASTCLNAMLDRWIKRIQFASLGDTQEHVEVLSLDADAFDLRAAKGTQFSKPVLIREDFADADRFSLESFGETLRRTYDGERLHVQKESPISVTEFLVDITKDISTANALSLPNLSRAIEPSLTYATRFNLLRHIIHHRKARVYRTASSETAGKQYLVTPFDVDSCQEFNILGGSGAFSGAHLDSLNGTWLRNLFGEKLWFIVPQENMSPADWEDFARQGDQWDPGDRGRAILLRKGDVLFMPPGVRIIHAVLTTRTSLMQGGMVWDDHNVTNVLQSLAWIGKHQQSKNEAVAWQFGEIVTELHYLTLEQQDSSYSHISRQSGFREALMEVISMGCTCKPMSSCKPESCSCYSRRRRCTLLCRSHQIESIDLREDACVHEQPFEKKVQRKKTLPKRRHKRLE